MLQEASRIRCTAHCPAQQVLARRQAYRKTKLLYPTQLNFAIPYKTTKYFMRAVQLRALQIQDGGLPSC